ncbi:MAG: transcription antitermination factor NusB [Planctomycetota bacterium]
MVDRRAARILAMQALCQFEVLHEDFAAQLDEFLAEDAPPQESRTYARGLVEEARRRLVELDRHISEVAEHWDIKRMPSVDRNVLRVAVCELLYRPEVPPVVVINEAVEIGKAFSTGESGAFINGVLDAIEKLRKQDGGKQPEKSGVGNGTV